jgi:transposase
MGRELYWLSDTEWSRLEPLMPRGQGRPHLILLTPGNASDMATAPRLLRALPPTSAALVAARSSLRALFRPKCEASNISGLCSDSG